MSVLKNKTVITKKQRQCLMCLRIFPAQTKMNYHVNIWEGEFCASYSCMTCVEIINGCQDPDGYPEGYVREMLDKGQTPEQYLEQMKFTASPETNNPR